MKGLSLEEAMRKHSRQAGTEFLYTIIYYLSDFWSSILLSL